MYSILHMLVVWLVDVHVCIYMQTYTHTYVHIQYIWTHNIIYYATIYYTTMYLTHTCSYVYQSILLYICKT